MVKKLGAAALVIALASVPLWVWQWGEVPGASKVEPTAEVTRVDLEEPGEAGSTAATVPAGESEERQALPTVHEEAEDLAVLLDGTVMDCSRRPVGGVRVSFERLELPEGTYSPDEEAVAVRADAGGSFQIPFPETWGRLAAADEHYTTTVPFWLTLEPPEEDPVIFVAPRKSYAGTVIDEHGSPVPEVPLGIYMSPATARGLLPGEQRSESRSWKAESDRQGAFSFEDVGWTEGLLLYVSLDGFQDVREDLPPHSLADLEIVLQLVPTGPDSITGTVVDSRGEAVEGAHVALVGGTAMCTAGDGRFTLEVEGDPSPLVVQAVKEGLLPARLELPALAQDPEPDPIVLVLEGEPLTIAGRVEDDTGEPVPLASVWTPDGTRFGEVWFEGGGGSTYNLPCHVEDILAPVGRFRLGRWATADEEGQFEIRGMLPRAYEIRAIHPTTMEVTTLPTVQGGDCDVRIVLGGTEPARRVAGRVVYGDGSPVTGARLVCVRDRTPGIERLSAPFPSHGWREVDAEGHFAFDAICVQGTHLNLVGEGVPRGQELELDPEMDLEDLEICIPRVCRFQVVLEGNPEEARWLKVLDEDGRTLRMHCDLGRWMTSTILGDLVGGRSEVLHVGDDARTLVLLRQGAVEVRRIPIRLQPGEIQVIRP